MCLHWDFWCSSPQVQCISSYRGVSDVDADYVISTSATEQAT